MLKNTSSDEELERELEESGNIPKAFLCPISLRIMKDPVMVVETGQTYERNQIEGWFEERTIDPLTSKQLKSRDLRENYALRSTIEDFKKNFKMKREALCGSSRSRYISENHHGTKELKHSFKVSVIGPSSVGKTSLIRKMCYNEWDPNAKATVNCDIEFVVVKVGDSLIRLCFWDTAGSEKYHSFIFNNIRGSDAVLTVFDASDDLSLNEAKNYFYKAPKGDALLFLVGNKADLLKGEELTSANRNGQRFADNNCMIFFSTSAKNGTNTNQLYLLIARSLSAMSVREKSSTVLEMRQDRSATCCTGRCCSHELSEDWPQESLTSKRGNLT